MFFSFQKASIGRLVKQTTPLTSPFTESDVYDTMFSDSTRGDISPSELGSGEGSGDADFTVFSTDFFTDSSLGTSFTEESETPVSGATTEGRTGTTEFEIETTESSDITEETDTTLEGSGTTIEEGFDTTSEEGSGASSSTDAFTDITTVEETSGAYFY